MSADSSPSDDLPRHLSESGVRAAVAEADTLLDVQQQLRIGRTGARRLLKARGLLDNVTQAGPQTVGAIRESLRSER